MHLIAFSEGAYEQHCPEQVKSLVNDAPPAGLKAHKLIRLLLILRSSHSGSLRRRRKLNYIYKSWGSKSTLKKNLLAVPVGVVTDAIMEHVRIFG